MIKFWKLVLLCLKCGPKVQMETVYFVYVKYVTCLRTNYSGLSTVPSLRTLRVWISFKMSCNSNSDSHELVGKLQKCQTHHGSASPGNKHSNHSSRIRIVNLKWPNNSPVNFCEFLQILKVGQKVIHFAEF